MDQAAAQRDESPHRSIQAGIDDQGAAPYQGEQRSVSTHRGAQARPGIHSPQDRAAAVPTQVSRRSEGDSQLGGKALPITSAAAALASKITEESPAQPAGGTAAPALVAPCTAYDNAGTGSRPATASRPPNHAEKTKAVASLQKLFFEEMKKGGDANAAAASALKRLAEEEFRPSTGMESLSMTGPRSRSLGTAQPKAVLRANNTEEVLLEEVDEEDEPSGVDRLVLQPV